MKASVVIRTHNNERIIGAVLEAVSRQSFPDYEVVVVDSGSTDNTYRTVRRYPHAFVEYSSAGGFSYGGSLNAGFEAAKGEYVVCLSSHCVPLHEGWLGALVGAMNADERLAAAWGPLLFEARDGSKVGEGVEVVDLEGFYRRPNRGLQNSNSIIRRSLWEERPFSEEVERCEDQEWAYHFLKQGYATAIVHGAPALYEIPYGAFAYGEKMMRDFLTLYELFGYGPDASIAALARSSVRLFGAVALGRRSPGVVAKLFSGMVGMWLAGAVVRYGRKRGG